MKKILLTSFLLALFAGVHGQITLTNDIFPSGDGNPSNFHELNGKLYFSANDGVNGRELWQYNPANNTSQMVADISAGALNGLSADFDYNNNTSCVLNDKLYFTAGDETTGWELWVYDGVTPPSLVSDIRPGALGSVPADFIALNNKLYFMASVVGIGAELIVYDPATNVIQPLSDINSGIEHSWTREKVVFNNKLYFSALSDAFGYELYVYDPSNNTVSLTSDMVPGTGSFEPKGMMVANGKMYFTATTAAFGRELYSYTTTGIFTRITDLTTGAGSGVDDVTPILFNGKIFFCGGDFNLFGFELYALDLATNLVNIVYDIYPGSDASNPQVFCIYSNKLFFRAGTLLYERELWSYDGVNPPAMVEDLMPGDDYSYPYLLNVMGERLYFGARNAANGFELFYYQDHHASITEYNNNVNTTAYPIPAVDNVNIRVTLEESASFSVNVYDITGKTVYTLPTADYMMGTNEINIPLQGLSIGNYQYSLVGSKGVMGSGKIIKQ